ncbi:MAG: diacylglycerol O-acyltransferase / wax synthase, partial [Actinomycetota bacterium]|nr:diacylglycerol O-acyltransferase / wax synthase [Actinomycetota bacterium]
MGCWTLREVSLLVADRLSPLDVSFLYFEEATTPMHVGGVAVFQAPADGFDYER